MRKSPKKSVKRRVRRKMVKSEYQLKGLGVLLQMYGGAGQEIEDRYNIAKKEFDDTETLLNVETSEDKKDEIKNKLENVKVEMESLKDKMKNLLKGVSATAESAVANLNSQSYGSKLSSGLKSFGNFLGSSAKSVGKTLSNSANAIGKYMGEESTKIASGALQAKNIMSKDFIKDTQNLRKELVNFSGGVKNTSAKTKQELINSKNNIQKEIENVSGGVKKTITNVKGDLDVLRKGFENLSMKVKKRN
jgi:hypothetical protein